MSIDLNSYSQVRDYIRYDPWTGIITYRRDLNSNNWLPARVGHNGYASVYLTKELSTIYAHRVAWFLWFGKWPTHEIDHENGIKTDNRLWNIREATRSQNAANQPLRAGKRFKGIGRNKSGLPFKATIRVNWKSIYLGSYATEEEAAAAYNVAATKHFGSFARLNVIPEKKDANDE